MYYVQEVKENIFWVGVNDRRVAKFENMFPLPNGISYNSYLIKDEKTVLLDTVDYSNTVQFLTNVKHVLGDRDLDYLIINHMEPDHGGSIENILDLYPNVKIIGNKKTFTMLKQFYTIENIENNLIEVKENDELSVGKHKFKFIMAPMVHWPEVMMTYEETEKILFSADAFGSFGAINGNLFMDDTDFENYYMKDTRRYYTNIVGKYGVQVQNVFKKIASLSIEMICSLHGPIWRSDISVILEKYNLWSTYTPEKTGIVLMYGSMYGNTEKMVDVIAGALSAKGVKDIKVFDISKTNSSYIIADAFKTSHLIFAAPSYNAGLYSPMESLLMKMIGLNLQKRKFALVGSGTWSISSTKVMKEMISRMKGFEEVTNPLEILSSFHPEQSDELNTFVNEIYNSMTVS